MTKAIKNSKTNKVSFYLNGVKVYPVSVSGNIAEFKNGELIIF